MRDGDHAGTVGILVGVALALGVPACDGGSGGREALSSAAPPARGSVTVISIDGTKRPAPPEDAVPRSSGEASAPEASDAPARGSDVPAPGTDNVAPDRAEPTDTSSLDAAPWRDRDPTSTNDASAPAPITASLHKLVRDLEFTPGLREPFQQNVVPPPAPWTPSAAADAASPPVIEAISPRMAGTLGGVVVTIRGRNLDAMQVLFGLSPAAIVSQAPEVLVVQAPPGIAGDAPIVVTNRDGNYVVAATTFQYVR